MSQTLNVRIRADKSGPEPGPGESWPVAGFEVDGDLPDTFDFPKGWVAKMVERGLVTLEGAATVIRPSQPDPEVQDDGLVIPTADHMLKLGTLETPHIFTHATAIVLHTTDGDARYLVEHQPDKYVDGADDDEPMTLEHYADGNTRVDHYYSCRLEQSSQED